MTLKYLSCKHPAAVCSPDPPRRRVARVAQSTRFLPAGRVLSEEKVEHVISCSETHKVTKQSRQDYETAFVFTKELETAQDGLRLQRRGSRGLGNGALPSAWPQPHWGSGVFPGNRRRARQHPGAKAARKEPGVTPGSGLPGADPQDGVLREGRSHRKGQKETSGTVTKPLTRRGS